MIVWLVCHDNMSIFLCYNCRPVDDVEAGEIDGVIDCSGDATGVDGKNILLLIIIMNSVSLSIFM